MTKPTPDAAMANDVLDIVGSELRSRGMETVVTDGEGDRTSVIEVVRDGDTLLTIRHGTRRDPVEVSYRTRTVVYADEDRAIVGDWSDEVWTGNLSDASTFLNVVTDAVDGRTGDLGTDPLHDAELATAAAQLRGRGFHGFVVTSDDPATFTAEKGPHTVAVVRTGEGLTAEFPDGETVETRFDEAYGTDTTGWRVAERVEAAVARRPAAGPVRSFG